MSGGPPGGATCLGGLNGLNKGGNQPPSGLVRPQGPKVPRVGNPRGAAAPPPGAGAPLVGNPKGATAPPPS